MRPGCRARCSTSCVHDADNVTAHGQGPTLHKSLKTIKTCASNSQKCSTMIPRLNESDTLSLHSCSAWLESLDSIIRRIIPNVAVSSFAELKKLQLRCAMSNRRRCSANIKKMCGPSADPTHRMEESSKLASLSRATRKPALRRKDKVHSQKLAQTTSPPVAQLPLKLARIA